MMELGTEHQSAIHQRRKRGHARLIALIAATLLIAGVWSINWFRSFCIGAEFLTTIEDRTSKYGFDPKAGISNLYLGYWRAYVGTSRHCVGIGRELEPLWSEDPALDDYPRVKFESYRSNRYPYSFVEFTASSNWHIGGLGTYHSDIHPLGGLTATPYDDRGFVIPYWLLSMIVAALWWRRWRRWRVHRRIERGECPDCGYDLRGSPAIGMLVACPECGQATISPIASLDLAPS